ncbi:AAA family ATPase [Luteimonas sp BLCC-B24]|uniref:ExeA family protein n=1 Tax=Luteimonas sp. BLCC-B24 TaxID=3025317 RepID=UPI00234CC93A|nr:ExeA family protein [Luteimonas sp. BLCC-B24]MDC7805924.1 AAA family ATPase [Luteimonas sp. BLCC-B24]
MNPALVRHLQALDLTHAPFPPTPDASAWFRTPVLDGELTEAAHCLRTRAGFVLLTGEVGTGKSTFLRRLLHELDGEGVSTSMVFNTFLQADDLLAAVLRDFGLRPRGNPARDIETLNRFLVRRWQEQATCVLVIDDAQNLTLESLELLRLLTNLETGQEKLLQIVLSGQPELRDNLDQPRIRQLTSRICKHVRLETMSPGDLRDYVGFRLAAAGNPEPGIRLQEDAVSALYRASGGNPRRIHLLMDRCLYGLYGRVPAQRVVDAALVRTAASEAGALPARRRTRKPLALAACIGGAFAVASLSLLLGSPHSHADDGAGLATVAAPITAVSAAVQPVDDGWDACLEAIEGRGAQVHVVTGGWPAHMPARDDLCLRAQGDGWLAAWPTGLRPEDFLAGGEARERVRMVQALLGARGLYHGDIDGVYGPRMREAIAALQQRHGLPGSGLPDASTLLLIDILLATDAAAPTTEPPHDGHG